MLFIAIIAFYYIIINKNCAFSMSQPMSYHIMDTTHDMSYVTTIMASLIGSPIIYIIISAHVYTQL